MKFLRVLRLSDVILWHGTSCMPSRTMYTEKKHVQSVLDAVLNLAPHPPTHDQSQIDNTLSFNDQGVKTYRSLPKLCSAFEESLQNKPMLTLDAESTANTIGVLKVMHGNLGLGLNGMTSLLRRCPDIYSMDRNQVENRIEFLRKMKVQGTCLQKAISRTPQILLMSETEISIATKFLITNLDFTMAELPELFLNSPNVVLDPPDVTEEKYQYLFFTMGQKKQQDYVKYGVLQFSLNRIKNRHIFLDRRGQFQLPTKTGSTTISNPKLHRIICNSDQYFCREVALCTLDEFKLFKRVLAQEEMIRMAENNDGPSSEATMQLADRFLSEMSKPSSIANKV